MTVHIATSAELGRVVRRGLREPVRFVADNLLVGPCSAAAQAHVRARCDHWALRGRERTRFLASFREMLEAIEARERVLVWTSRLWADTAALWALCAWRLAAWPAEPDVDIVLLGDPRDPTPPRPNAGGPGAQYLRVTPSLVRRGREEARSLSLTRVREMARSWRRLAGPSPILAGKHRPTRQPLPAMGAYQAGFFPRLAGSGLALSRFDDLLFSCVGDRWSTPLDVFVRRGPAGEELREWLSLTGDVLLATRLAQWASHPGSEAALECEPHQAGNVMKAARYRLSVAGQALQRQGLTHLARGAPLPVWGATAYDPKAPWVVVEEHAGQPRLERAVGEPRR